MDEKNADLKHGINLGNPAIPDEIPGFPHFGHIELRHIPNARDLGGMPAADGKRIARARLIRSGDLHGASEEDRKVLVDDHSLRRVVDFRTKAEREGQPDPVDDMPDVSFHDLPVFTQAALGITHEGGAKGDLAALSAFMDDPFSQVEKLYGTSLLGDEGMRAYGAFLEILLAAPEGATLWHCTEGKDRAGLASVLVEYALGVPMEYIRADYLATNVFARKAAEKILDALARHGVLKGIDVDMDAIMYANMNYLDSALAAVDEKYGSMDAYLEQALGIGANEVAELRAMYLED